MPTCFVSVVVPRQVARLTFRGSLREDTQSPCRAQAINIQRTRVACYSGTSLDSLDIDMTRIAGDPLGRPGGLPAGCARPQLGSALPQQRVAFAVLGEGLI